MSFRKLTLPLFIATLCLGQATRQAMIDLPGVDWKGLTGAKQTAALRILQTESCACGCGMKLAECRVKDPGCEVSTKLSAAVVKLSLAGKSPAEIKAELLRVANEPPPIFEDPVTISTAGDPTFGPDNARMTIVEFSDFQCPYCSKVVTHIKQIEKMFSKDVRFIYKQFPLDSHSEAEMASEAALAAQAQGKFWEMHDLIYAGFPNLDRKLVDGYAKQLKLDMNRFNAEMASHKYQARVLMEAQEGEKAGVQGTPTFFFNGRRYNGNFDTDSIAPILKQELGQK